MLTSHLSSVNARFVRSPNLRRFSFPSSDFFFWDERGGGGMKTAGESCNSKERNSCANSRKADEIASPPHSLNLSFFLFFGVLPGEIKSLETNR